MSESPGPVVSPLPTLLKVCAAFGVPCALCAVRAAHGAGAEGCEVTAVFSGGFCALRKSTLSTLRAAKGRYRSRNTSLRNT